MPSRKRNRELYKNDCTEDKSIGKEDDLKSPPSSESVSKYEFISTISEGSSGIVYKAKNKDTGDVYALKRLFESEYYEDDVSQISPLDLREIRMLRAIKHRNVVSIHNIVLGKNGEVFIAMEYVEHELKRLLDTKRNLSISQVKSIMQQLLRAISCMHSNGIMHRDLKTSNLLLTSQGILKICDFGLAREFSSDSSQYSPDVSTLWYRAPEVLLGGSYSNSIDIWSAGCIFAELVLNMPLFHGASGEIAMVDKIFQILSTPNETTWPGFSDLPYVRRFNWKRYENGTLADTLFDESSCMMLSKTGVELLSKMLSCNPSTRISARDALSLEWFQEVPLPEPAFSESIERDSTRGSH